MKIIRKINTLLDRARVIARSVVTRITAITAALAAVAPVVIDQLPEGWQGQAQERVTQVLIVAAGVVEIIKRVTPVPKAKRGLLPVKQKRGRGGRFA